MASADPETHDRAMRRYGRLEEEFQAAGGYAAESEAAAIASSLGLPDRVLGQPLRTLSGGQRRRVELSRILFSSRRRPTLLLDEPTNHLDADSIVWLRDFLKAYQGGLVVISHDVGLLEHAVNRVFHLDANRGRARRLQRRLEDLPRRSARPTSGAASGSGRTPRSRRRRSRRRPTGCATRRPRRGPRRAWTSGPSQAARRPGGGAPQRQGRQAALPGAGAVRQDAAHGRGPVEVLRLARGVHRRRPRDRPGQPGRHPRPQRRRQDDAAAAARRRRGAGHRRGRARARAASSATTRRSTRRSTRSARCWRTCAVPRPTCGDAEVRRVLGSFLFSGDDVDEAGRGALRRREDPARAGHAGRVERQRAAARRADEQPRPGQPRGGPRRAAHATPAPSSWSRTTRARSTRCSRSG